MLVNLLCFILNLFVALALLVTLLMSMRRAKQGDAGNRSVPRFLNLVAAVSLICAGFCAFRVLQSVAPGLFTGLFGELLGWIAGGIATCVHVIVPLKKKANGGSDGSVRTCLFLFAIVLQIGLFCIAGPALQGARFAQMAVFIFLIDVASVAAVIGLYEYIVNLGHMRSETEKMEWQVRLTVARHSAAGIAALLSLLAALEWLIGQNWFPIGSDIWKGVGFGFLVAVSAMTAMIEAKVTSPAQPRPAEKLPAA